MQVNKHCWTVFAKPVKYASETINRRFLYINFPKKRFLVLRDQILRNCKNLQRATTNNKTILWTCNMKMRSSKGRKRHFFLLFFLHNMRLKRNCTNSIFLLSSLAQKKWQNFKLFPFIVLTSFSTQKHLLIVEATCVYMRCIYVYLKKKNASQKFLRQ